MSSATKSDLTTYVMIQELVSKSAAEISGQVDVLHHLVDNLVHVGAGARPQFIALPVLLV